MGFHVGKLIHHRSVVPVPWEADCTSLQVGVATESGTQFVVSILGTGSHDGFFPWGGRNDGVCIYLYTENHIFLRLKTSKCIQM